MMIVDHYNLTITRHTKGGIPSLPFVEVKEAILGREYELSLVFPTLADSKHLHYKWKKKDTPVNTLSFPLDKDSGEIIITLSRARQEASTYHHTYHNHLLFLFIHSCLHLKGMAHGARMEEQEQLWYEQFKQ